MDQEPDRTFFAHNPFLETDPLILDSICRIMVPQHLVLLSIFWRLSGPNPGRTIPPRLSTNRTFFISLVCCTLVGSHGNSCGDHEADSNLMISCDRYGISGIDTPDSGDFDA